MPLPQLGGTLGRKRAAHLLRRATFGPNKQQIDSFSGLTAAAAVNQLFQAQPVPPLPIDPNTGQPWVNSPPNAASDDVELQEYFKGWWLGLMLNSGISIKEKLVFFLHSHFTTIQATVDSSRSLYFQNALFRQYAFDNGGPAFLNFRDLTKKICVDNAMVKLLDGRLNVRGSVNENFAREFFELYTIGRGLVGQLPPTTQPGDYFHFTEQDVVAAAKVFSGLDFDDDFAQIDMDTTLPRAVAKGTAGGMGLASQHDNDPKLFSNRFGGQTIQANPALLQTGQATEASLLDEISQLVNMVFAQTETAKNICRKIYRFFVYYNITPDIDNNIISVMANDFRNNGFKIEPIIRDLLGSQHFYEAAGGVNDDNFGAIIKSPLDLTLGTLRFFEYQLPTAIADFYSVTGSLVSYMSNQGMNFLNPFDVAGYEAYHQFPIYNRYWISTNSLTRRYEYIGDVLTVDNITNPQMINIDVLTFMKSRFAANALDPDALIRELVTYLFPLSTETTEITTSRLNYFKSRHLSLGAVEPDPLVFWQTRWSTAEVIPDNREDARGMLQDLFNSMLQSPEYQLF